MAIGPTMRRQPALTFDEVSQPAPGVNNLTIDRIAVFGAIVPLGSRFACPLRTARYIDYMRQTRIL